MFEVVPFKVEYAIPLLHQTINADMREIFLGDAGKALEGGPSVAGLWNGEPVVVGGILPIWQGRGHIWCVFNENTKHNPLPVFRAMRAHLKEKLKEFHRIEVSVPNHFEHGKRRVRMLGFELETERARKYLFDQTDCSVFVMVRE